MNLASQLRNIRLFSNLDSFQRDQLASICRYRSLRPGTRLVRQADLGANLFIIESGEAIIHHVNEQGLRRPVGMLRAGDSFGATSLFLGEPRDATVTALTEMTLWTLDRSDFQALQEEYPSISRKLLIPEDVATKLRAPHYSWLTPGEMVVYTSHRHWMTFVRAMLFSTLLVLTYFAFLAWLGSHDKAAPMDEIVLVLPPIFLYAFVTTWHWFDWRNDYFVVTTQRVTHRERVAFVYESREETPIDRVQNISVRRDFMAKLLNYGSLSLETASEVGRMAFSDIPEPESMREIIFVQITRARAIRRAAERHLIRSELETHLNLRTAAQTEQTATDEELPADLTSSRVPDTELNVLSRAIGWLLAIGFLPQVRIIKDDQIIWRKHWLFLIGNAFPPVLLGLATGLVTTLGFLGWPHWAPLNLQIWRTVWATITLASLIWFWWRASDWSNDLYIVTDERIIDIEKRPLFFAEQRREANLGMIQNISLKIPNFMAATFGYGDVVVNTAGSGEFTFTHVPRPHDVQREIFQRMGAFRETQRRREAELRRAELAEWFSIYREVDGKTTEGVSFLQPNGTWERLGTEDGLVSGNVRAIALTPDGSPWFATDQGASRQMANGKWRELTTLDGLPSDDVYRIAVEQDNERVTGIWFGTARGACRFDRKNHATIYPLDGQAIRALCIRRDGTVWFGTRDGVSVLDPDDNTRVIAPEGISLDQVQAILETNQGDLWVATWHGVACLRSSKGQERWQHLGTAEGLASQTVFCMAEAPDGTLWFGTDLGATRLSPQTGSWDTITTRDGLPHNTVWAIATAPDGTVWFGTDGGACRLTHLGLWTTYTSRNGLPQNRVRALAIGPDGTVWFA